MKGVVVHELARPRFQYVCPFYLDRAGGKSPPAGVRCCAN
jgi:hypothetical protein